VLRVGEGKNLVSESRSAESGFERLPELAAELVGLKVDVIAAFGNRTIMALKQATPTISWLRAAADDSALVDRGQKKPSAC
jgi:putative ABC transport system substrate-binding protein